MALRLSVGRHPEPSPLDGSLRPGIASSAPLSDRAFEAYLVEYEQCVESYRHTVSTIWKASAVVSVLTAGVFAFAFSADNVLGSGATSMGRIAALLPMIVWCFGIYRPLNRYAEWKCDRLAAIERLLSDSTAGLEMKHFRDYRDNRRGTGSPEVGHGTRAPLRREARRILTLKIITEPRIVEVVTACGIGLVLIEVALVAHEVAAA